MFEYKVKFAGFPLFINMKKRLAAKYKKETSMLRCLPVEFQTLGVGTIVYDCFNKPRVVEDLIPIYFPLGLWEQSRRAKYLDDITVVFKDGVCSLKYCITKIVTL